MVPKAALASDRVQRPRNRVFPHCLPRASWRGKRVSEPFANDSPLLLPTPRRRGSAPEAVVCSPGSGNYGFFGRNYLLLLASMSDFVRDGWLLQPMQPGAPAIRAAVVFRLDSYRGAGINSRHAHQVPEGLVPNRPAADGRVTSHSATNAHLRPREHCSGLPIQAVAEARPEERTPHGVLPTRGAG